MKNITQKYNLQKILYTIGVGMIMVIFAFAITQYAYAAITTSLDIGDSGPQVTELQRYLATNASIYPSGLVTGYFGPLTQAAVARFQTAQGIVSAGTPETTGYGRVGPQTMARINSLLAGGGTSSGQSYWDTAPILSAPSINVGPHSVTMTWTTNEPAQGQIYYDTSPLRTDEATGPRQLPYVSGQSVTGNPGQTMHTLTVQNLQSNTTYYFLTRAIDSTGNMSMIWPSSFKTSN